MIADRLEQRVAVDKVNRLEMLERGNYPIMVYSESTFFFLLSLLIKNKDWNGIFEIFFRFLKLKE